MAWKWPRAKGWEVPCIRNLLLLSSSSHPPPLDKSVMLRDIASERRWVILYGGGGLQGSGAGGHRRTVFLGSGQKSLIDMEAKADLWHPNPTAGRPPASPLLHSA